MQRPSGVSSASELNCAEAARSLGWTARRGMKRDGHAIAERDRAGFVEQQHIHVARGFDRASAHRENIPLEDAIHSGNADGAEQSADRCGNQTNQQRDQNWNGKYRAGINAERFQRDADEQKDKRQRREQNRERDFVRRFLTAARLPPARSCGRESRRPFSIVTRMTMRSLNTRVPPVTALRSPPLSRMTGADSPVIAASSTLAIPSITSPSAGMMSPASQTTRSPFCKIGRWNFFLAAILQATRHRFLARPAQAGGLRFTAAFRHRFGEIGEQHREPEPDRELRDEAAQIGGRR